MLESELIIFDCDGVLVDTEPLTNRVLARCVSAVGWEIDQAYSIAHFKGRNLDDILVDVETKLGKKLPELMDGYRKQMYIEIHEFGVPALGGIHELLDALDAMGDQAPHRCIGTNAPLEKARLTLGGSGLIDRFGHRDGTDRQTMFSAYEVGKWKPDPGLFLHAAAAMGHEPETCIVVEDSTAGVIAAVAAGMRVIGLADLTPADDLAKAGATQIVESHHELVATLQENT
ncbi:MAG: HAD-IA family hydrolase [Phycisphaerales bacterium]|nr:HAD-IA family hydrolase [Phycisphaerales bacterium]